MIQLSRTQDEEVGDGTTSVIILAGELLQVCLLGGGGVERGWGVGWGGGWGGVGVGVGGGGITSVHWHVSWRNVKLGVLGTGGGWKGGG